LKRISYYLDTTVFNFVFADDAPEKTEITVQLLKRFPLIAEGVYISEEVIREINRAPEPRKSQLAGLVGEMKPLLLEVDREAEELAERYIKEGIIPVKYRSDALHIAIAVTNGIAVIVSWNFEHIVKLKTRIMVNGVNRLLGYRDVEICSPEEVFE
jgi:hypothetical protein